MTFPSLAAEGTLASADYKLFRMAVLSPTFNGQFNSDLNVAAGNVRFRNVSFTEPRPVAVIETISHGYELASGGSQSLLRATGTLRLYLAIDATGDEDDVQAHLNAKNFFGSVMDDIIGLSGADQTDDAIDPNSHLTITSCALEEFGRALLEDRGTFGDFYYATYLVSWGD